MVNSKKIMCVVNFIKKMPTFTNTIDISDLSERLSRIETK